MRPFFAVIVALKSVTVSFVTLSLPAWSFPFTSSALRVSMGSPPADEAAAPGVAAASGSPSFGGGR